MKLVGITCHVWYDRVIDIDKHYLDIGGYEVEYNGKKFNFDFTTSTGNVVGRNRNIMEWQAYDLDESFSDVIFPDVIRKGEFTEFFLYTGENEDAEIHALRVENVKFEFVDDDANIIYVCANDHQINEMIRFNRISKCNSMVQKIATHCVYSGLEHTYNGNYCIDAKELCEEFYINSFSATEVVCAAWDMYGDAILALDIVYEYDSPLILDFTFGYMFYYERDLNEYDCIGPDEYYYGV